MIPFYQRETQALRGVSLPLLGEGWNKAGGAGTQAAGALTTRRHCLCGRGGHGDHPTPPRRSRGRVKPLQSSKLGPTGKPPRCTGWITQSLKQQQGSPGVPQVPAWPGYLFQGRPGHPSLTPLQPQWPFCCSLDTPNSFQPQGPSLLLPPGGSLSSTSTCRPLHPVQA